MYDCIEGVDTAIIVNKMLNHSPVFPWILNRFLINDNEEHEYNNSMRKVACDRLSREVECNVVIWDFFGKPEMLGLLASIEYATTHKTDVAL
ncbi:hypothetical protein PRIPAC_72441, partial [Pristionchus pacificus]|uniref:Uncharacterized protein n=1 Tax=Pristionchus pacificus TaxID=54126 RepID=A0A2A6CSL9_PRIPA